MMKKLLKSPIATAVLFVAAAALLLTGGIGAAFAAPRIQSADYRAEVVLTDIQTALTENGNVVEGDDALLSTLVPSGEKFKVGKTYDEKLAVRNVGKIDEYVRVTVTKFWNDANGKDVALDPALIDLHFVTGQGWTIDKDASTTERTVLYYAKPIAPGEDTSLFADKLTINGKVVTSVTKLADGSEEFDYEGVKFRIKAVADAVQTHNATDAMTSAWGRTN